MARVVMGSASDLPSLEPLWVAVHRAHVASMPELAPYLSDAETWAERSALYALSVLPEHRGQGIGTALMDALERELEALGIGDVIVGALAGNEEAVRLYRRRGFRPTWLYLARFDGR